MMRIVLLLVVACACACSAALELSSFQNHANLRSGEYDIYWNISDESIVLALEVRTTGWIGFAIGEQTSGSMPGADYVTGWVDDSTTIASIQDRFALDYVMPTIDSCQDWDLIEGVQSDGKTTLVVSRLLKTTDNQDREIVAGPMRVLYAFGKSDAFGYHGTTRAVTSVEFVPLDSAKTPDVVEGNLLTHDILMSNSQIPPEETVYLCQTFELPNVKDGHILQIDPVIQINPSAPSLVHHFIAFACYTNESNWNTHPYPQQCNKLSNQCDTVFYAWAPGIESMVLPKEAGFRIGKAKSYAFRYMYLEVHYNNIYRFSGLSDNSGIRVHYTTNVTRPYDAGILTLGDALVDFSPLAPGRKEIALESECPSECTSKFPHDITVFADFLHMHQVGSQIWNTHWRDGSMVVENRIDFWDFALQFVTPVNYTVKRGDSLHLHCTYNTMSQTAPVRFGPASTDEMCMNFLSYYPILATDYGSFGVCGNLGLNGTQVTACGGYHDDGLIFQPLTLNPPNPDPPGTGEIIFGRSCGESPTAAPVNSAASADEISRLLLAVYCLAGIALLI